MKIGCLISSYHATQYLPLVLKMYEWVDKIVVMNYRFKTVEPTTDDTRKICDKFNHSNIYCESGEGLEQHEIRNRGLALLSDCDLVWMSDADEIILPDDQNIILNRMADRRRLTGLAYYASCKIVDYNGDLYHASPPRAGLTLVMVCPKTIKFSRLRSIEQNIHEAKLPHATMHHLGLVFPEKTLAWKVEWEHKEENEKKEIVLSNWKIRREVIPPNELLDLVGVRNNTWGFEIVKIPYKEKDE